MSNDIEQHKILAEKDIAALILDHHEIEYQSEYACIINVQDSNYPNKALTGAGVAWQFCRAFDDLYAAEPHANDFLDLCAIGNIGDMSDYRKLETRAIVNLGLRNITNPFAYSMCRKNDYSIQKMNGINYYSIAFYLVPFINATIRSGTVEEKKTVFDSLLLEYTYEDVESSKRGEKGKMVPLYEKAVTVAERVKRRQTKIQDETVELFEQKIKEQNLLDNALLMFLCEPGEVDRNVAGLIANKEQAKYQRPCLVLTKTRAEDGEVVYAGSGRNYSLSEKNDLKSVLETTGLTNYVAGHANAFGTSISEKNLESFIDATNEQYKDVDQTPTYWVDYIWNSRTIDSEKILDLGGLNIYGQEIPESLVAVQNIALNPSMITLMGVDKGHPTLKIRIGDVDVIKFKSSEEEWEEFCGENKVINFVAKPKVNEWNGNVSPQLLIEDFELEEDWIF